MKATIALITLAFATAAMANETAAPAAAAAATTAPVAHQTNAITSDNGSAPVVAKSNKKMKKNKAAKAEKKAQDHS